MASAGSVLGFVFLSFFLSFFFPPLFESNMLSGHIHEGILSCDLGFSTIGAPALSVSPRGISGDNGVWYVYLLFLRGVFCIVL